MFRVAQGPALEADALSTPQKAFEVSGPGIHTGTHTSIRLKKDPKVDGLLFNYSHEDIEFQAPAIWSRLSGTTRSTALVLRGDTKKRFELRTIEHFMASAFIYDLRGYQVLVDCPKPNGHFVEVPILDGSCKQWECLRDFKSTSLPKKRKVWLVVRDYELKDGDRSVKLYASPDRHCSHYVCQVDFGPHWIQKANYTMDWLEPEKGQRAFEKGIAPARTFGFKHELEALLERGLIQGASLDNAILLTEDGVENKEGFRVSNELAAHKLLDAIGDFALLGCPLIGTIDVYKAGHSLHLRALAEAVKSGALIQAELSDEGELFVQQA